MSSDILRNKQSKIGIRTQRGIKFFYHQDIAYLKANGRYTKIFFKNGESDTVTRVLKCLEDSLPSQIFCRIHKSYLVNINYILELKTDHHSSLILENGECLFIAKRRRSIVVEKLSDWIV